MSVGIVDSENRVEFKKLSLRMRNAVRDIYKMIDKTPDPCRQN